MKILLSLPVLIVVITWLICAHQLALGKMSKRLSLCIATGIYLLFCQPAADAFLAPLERHYSAYQGQPVAHIVVLGCSHSDDTFLPISDKPNACSKARLIEAMRILQLNPSATIHLSGDLARKITPHTSIQRQWLHTVGVNDQRIVTHTGATNTAQEAILVAGWLKQQQNASVALVTNAAHLPRAMVHFQQAGINPIAAPAEFFARDIEKPMRWQDLIPQISAPQSWFIWQYETAAWLELQFTDAD